MPSTPSSVDALPAKHERFVEEYLCDLNASAAAVRAGYSRKGAAVQGHRLLRNAKVAAAIAAGRQRLTEKAEISAERVLEEYARVAFADIRSVISWTSSGVVTVKPSAELTAEEAATIAEMQDVATANGRTVRVKLADKLEALGALARHLGLFVEKHEHAGPGGGPIRLSEGTIIVTGDEEEYVSALKAIRERDKASANANGLPMTAIGALASRDR
jgi:phage terminase small subunit